MFLQTASIVGETQFDVRIKPLRLIIVADPGARRADTLQRFGPDAEGEFDPALPADLVDISGGANLALTPVIRLGEEGQFSAAYLTFNGELRDAVQIRCTSNIPRVMDDFEVVTTPGVWAAELPMPGAKAPLEEDIVITYTCSPTAAAGGLSPLDSVRFDVRVLTYGLVLKSGIAALSAATLLPLPPDILLSPTAPLFLAAESGGFDQVFIQPKAIARAVVDGDLEEVTPNVVCLSSETSVLPHIPITSLTSEGKPITIPPSSGLAKTIPVQVNYVCQLECPTLPYTGSERASFSVVVYPRTLLAVAGSRSGLMGADGVAIAAGTLLRGEIQGRQLLPVVYETSDASDAVALVAVYPTAKEIEVDCTSDSPAVMGHVRGVRVTFGARVWGGTPVALPLPNPSPIDTESVVVTYKCVSERLEASFSVLVAGQRLDFATGSAVTMRTDSGDLIPPGTVVDRIRAVEGVQYAPGALVKLRAADKPTSVVCALFGPPEAIPPQPLAGGFWGGTTFAEDLRFTPAPASARRLQQSFVTPVATTPIPTTAVPVSTPAASTPAPVPAWVPPPTLPVKPAGWETWEGFLAHVLSDPSAQVLEISLEGEADLYLPRMPDVEGDGVLLEVRCRPVQDDPAAGYSAGDVFAVSIEVPDLYTPNAPLPPDAPRLRFGLMLGFRASPSDLVLEAIKAGVQVSVVETLGLGLTDVRVGEDEFVPLRRSLLEVRIPCISLYLRPAY